MAAPEPGGASLLKASGLRIEVPAATGGWAPAVDGISFELGPGERTALVGESGAGKSLTAMALLGLVPPPARLAGGSVLVGDTDMLRADEAARRAVRGRVIGFVPQEPASSLNPVLSMGFQIREALRLHRGLDGTEARRAARELLASVGLPDGEFLRAYPHQLSGGQAQRAALALALAGGPRLLVADEPTTGLDLTTQGGVLHLLDDLGREHSLALLLVTHDLAVATALVRKVLIMYAGELVETGPVDLLARTPLHPYTVRLVAAARGEPGSDRQGLRTCAAPPPGRWPAGCRFEPRCPLARQACRTTHPGLATAGPGHAVRCPVVLEGTGP